MKLFFVQFCAAIAGPRKNYNEMIIPISLQADFNVDRSADSDHGTHGQIVLDGDRKQVLTKNMFEKLK